MTDDLIHPSAKLPTDAPHDLTYRERLTDLKASLDALLGQASINPDKAGFLFFTIVLVDPRTMKQVGGLVGFPSLGENPSPKDVMGARVDVIKYAGDLINTLNERTPRPRIIQ